MSVCFFVSPKLSFFSFFFFFIVTLQLFRKIFSSVIYIERFSISKKELEEGAIQLLNVVYWQRSWDYCNIDKQRLTTLNHDSTDTEIEPKPLTTKFFASSQQLQHCTAEDII